MLSDDELLFFKTQKEQLNDFVKDKDNIINMKKVIARISSDTTSLLTCPKCDGHNITYTHKQTRAIDEGMTTFFSCSECQFKWKD